MSWAAVMVEVLSVGREPQCSGRVVPNRWSIHRCDSRSKKTRHKGRVSVNSDAEIQPRGFRDNPRIKEMMRDSGSPFPGAEHIEPSI